MRNIQSALFLTPKSTFYSDKKDIINAGEKVHIDIFKNDRELYTYLLFLGNATYYSKSLIIETLLANSINKPEISTVDKKRLEIENALILNALYSENMTHALKMLLRLKEKRINNKRTTDIILTFLFNRENIDVISLKYKSKIKDLIIHALGLSTVNKIIVGDKAGKSLLSKLEAKYSSRWIKETLFFVFNKPCEHSSENFQEYLKIKSIFENKDAPAFEKASTKLPLEVLIGFNNFYGSNFVVSSLYKKAVVSDKQKIQLQNAAKKNDVKIEIDYTKYSILELVKSIYSVNDSKDKEMILELINQKAGKFGFEEPGSCVIWDCSASHLGSDESKMNPHYKNMVLKSIFNLPTFTIGGHTDDGLIYPEGDSDITPVLLNAIESGYTKNIYVLSDGFENSGEFDYVYEKVLELYKDINVVHFNPVFSAKNFSAKTLHDKIPTIPFFDEKDFEYLELLRLLNTNQEMFKSVVREKIIHELL